jgi:RND family efflux transporter MFP subunit
MERFRALEPLERLRLVEKLAGQKDPYATAKRGDLIAAVVERGVVEPGDYADVYCKVKANAKEGTATTIKWVIDDGSIVKKGDRIALLDDSAIRDLLGEAAIKVKAAECALEQAEENVRLVRRENAVEVRLAEIEVKLAEADLKEAPAGKPKDVLELKVERAKLVLERASSRAKTQQAQADAEKQARAAVKASEVQRLAALEVELKQCELVAPSDGFVVHHVPPPGRFGGPPLLIAPGESVREGQKLLRVTALKKFVIETRVPEAEVPALRAGQAVQVRVDALPDKQLRGKVARVSPVASAADRFTADVKLYPVTIALDDPPEGLKPSMTVEVQIATGERKGVLQVPRKAVVIAGRDRICFVKSGQGVQEKKVVVGVGNATSVEIREGLKEGDAVVADPPALFVRP